MKIAFIILVVVFSLAIGFILGSHRGSVANAVSSSFPAKAPPTNPASEASHPRTAPFLVQSEWQEYHSARQKVLQANPELASEYKELIEQETAQQRALDAAMIQADPKVAPVVAKLEMIRQRNSGPHTASLAK